MQHSCCRAALLVANWQLLHWHAAERPLECGGTHQRGYTNMLLLQLEGGVLQYCGALPCVCMYRYTDLAVYACSDAGTGHAEASSPGSTGAQGCIVGRVRARW